MAELTQAMQSLLSFSLACAATPSVAFLGLSWPSIIDP